MTIVIDASVAAKWFIEEEDSDAAAALLGGGESLIAPDLLAAEVCNIVATKLRRGEANPEQIVESMQTLPQFIDDFASCVVLARRALQIARILAHPAYDCFYLALAELMKCQVVTADQRFLARIEATEWEAVVMRLGAEPIEC
ncbi:MAG: type II toxin-antitoxin system VapC family toxin [Rhodospirillales bacterium]